MHGRLRIRRRRGIVVPVALSLLFIMLALALSLADLERALAGFSGRVESEALGCDSVDLLQTQMLDCLHTNTGNAALGLPPLIPGAGGAVAPFHAPAGAPVAVRGQFNGSGEFSLHRVDPPAQGYTPGDGYAGALRGGRGILVPARHTLTLSTGSVPGRAWAEYATMYSACFPYALVAEGNSSRPGGGLNNLNGAVYVGHDVRASATQRGQDADESGVPAAVYAMHDVAVTGFLNGSAASQSGPITIGRGGLPRPGVPARPILNGFRASLATARQALNNGLTDLGTVLAPYLVTSPPGTVGSAFYSWGQGTTPHYLIPVGQAFVVPSGYAVNVPGNFGVQADLVVQDGAVLRVGGNLMVGGNLYLARHATVVVTGQAQLLKNLDVYSRAADSSAPTSALLADGDVTIYATMSSTPTLTASGPPPAPTPTPTPAPAPAPSPAPSSTPNPPGEAGGYWKYLGVSYLGPGQSYPTWAWIPMTGFGTNSPPPYVPPPTSQGYWWLRKNQTAGGGIYYFISWVAATPTPTPTPSPTPSPTPAPTPLPYLQTVYPNGSATTDDVPGAVVTGRNVAVLNQVMNQSNMTVTAMPGPTKAAGLLYASRGVNTQITRTVGVAWAGWAVVVNDFRYYPYAAHAFVRTAGGDFQVGATGYHRTAFGRVAP